ncbi:MAG: outer membrane protein assembly factor BamE [Legionella sp.]|nr:outer membrane protein assembly factor BamE [Legionella sp.]
MAEFQGLGKKMKILKILFLVGFSLGLVQCSTFDFSRRVAQQGNLLPQNKLERLKIGMSKNDVAILMGTSLLSPTFNNDRWDYAYTWRRGKGPMVIKTVSLYFAHERLQRIEHKP